MKRQPTEWRKYAVSSWHPTHIKNSCNSAAKPTTQLQNVQRNWIDVFQGGHRMTNRHPKRCPTPLIVKERKSEPQWGITSNLLEGLSSKRQDRYSDFSSESINLLPFTKKVRRSKCWQGCRERETLVHCWWCSHYGKQSRRILKVTSRTAVWSGKCTLGCTSRGNKTTTLKRYAPHVRNRRGRETTSCALMDTQATNRCHINIIQP